MKLSSIANSISTKPNHTSWRWKGNVSPLAYITLYIIYISRLCSLLQICKYIYRTVKKQYFKVFSVDKASQRINVPPYFVELYYMIWCAILFCAPNDCKVTVWLSAYFMGESLCWLLYYFFFRRFFEEKYAIMHSLEYIVILPLLIVCQARCISIIFDISFGMALGTLFFPSKNDNAYIIFLSILYTALIFGIFLSNLPIEQVKEKGNYRYNFSIIGNGHIVQNRLKPAIGKLTPAKIVAVFDVDQYHPKSEVCGYAKLRYFKISEDSLKNIHASNILWIATPSYTHIGYLSKYINSIFIAIEKPLIVNQAELSILQQLRKSGLWNRVFCLSYYYLEKALPLTFLYNPHTFYEKYLDFHDSDRVKVLSLFEKLGKVQDIQLTLCEDDDPREWVDTPLHGGQLFETFIHLAVLTHMMCRAGDTLETDRWTIKNEGGHHMSYIQCEGHTKSKETHFDLTMGKFMPKQQLRRGGILRFKSGEAHVDFDSQTVVARIKGEEDETFTISIKEEFRLTKYSVQLDMVRRCYEDYIHPSMVDGVDLQIKALEWLFEQKAKNDIV